MQIIYFHSLNFIVGAGKPKFIKGPTTWWIHESLGTLLLKYYPHWTDEESEVQRSQTICFSAEGGVDSEAISFWSSRAGQKRLGCHHPVGAWAPDPRPALFPSHHAASITLQLAWLEQPWTQVIQSPARQPEVRCKEETGTTAWDSQSSFPLLWVVSKPD